MNQPDFPLCVAALYHFVRFENPAELRDSLAAVCAAGGVKGTLLLAREGINGTIAGDYGAVMAVLSHIRAISGCEDLEVKLSGAVDMPFYRMKIRLKKEIVTMGQPDIDPLTGAGRYVRPQDWNALISDPDTIIIDTRNDYEVEIGSFAGAIDPKTQTFRDFPAWFRENRERLMGTDNPPKIALKKIAPKKIAMFCTGGIRCEKSTAFLKSEGIEEVYHLQGGILKYLEEIPPEQSLWQGECFVFDQRVSVGHGLALGTFILCHACRRPITEADRGDARFEEGVSCPACFDERSEAQRAAYRERQKQTVLAEARGEAHIGARMDG